MDSLIRPIERVVEATEWFVRTPSLRALHIATTELLRVPVLRHVVATEVLLRDDPPFFVLETPVEPGNDGWVGRSDELRVVWEGLAESAPEGVTMAPLWPPCEAKTPLARFALELSQALRALRPPMGGLVIVLAPTWVSDGERWCGDLRALLSERDLRGARFVLVEVDDAPSAPVMNELGARAERVDACADDRALREEAKKRLDAMRNAPPGATGPRLMGAAGPSVLPPVRRHQPKPFTPEERAVRARDLGVPEAHLDPNATRSLRVLVLSAALAMGDGDFVEGVKIQRETRDFCVQNGLHKEAVMNELVLAGYVMQTGDVPRAFEVFSQARARALEHGCFELAVQAQIAAASCLFVSGRVDEAAAAYAEGGRFGVDKGALVLAIEAFRMCGQLLLSSGHHEQAAAAFREALAAADKGGDAMKAGSSAPEAARALAALYRQYGHAAHADALEAQAAALEASAAPVGAKPETGPGHSRAGE